MTYHIPYDKQIQTALMKVIKKFRTVQSQNRLKKLVTNELNSRKKTFGVSEKRLRNIALKSNFVKLEIHSREGDPKEILYKCPVCGNDLVKQEER